MYKMYMGHQCNDAIQSKYTQATDHDFRKIVYMLKTYNLH